MLATLRSIAEAVSQQADLTSALACFVQMVKDAMQTQCCSIYFADYSQANRELMRLKNLRQADRIKMQIVEGLKGRISEEQYQQFSKWVEDGNSLPLPKLRKMASRYKQKYIFEKLKEDDITYHVMKIYGGGIMFNPPIKNRNRTPKN